MSDSSPTTIVWFRRDLRVIDHPALFHAFERGDRVIPLFIWSPEEEGRWPEGGASKWWLHYSLQSLEKDLAKLGLKLIIRKGSAHQCLKTIIAETGAKSLFWSRRYEPVIISRDKALKAEFTAQGLDVKSYNSTLMFEPWTIANKQGKPYQVFTPFWKACREKNEPELPLPIPVPNSRHEPPSIQSIHLDALELLPKIHWDTGLKKAWKPGTHHALKLLDDFKNQAVLSYNIDRDFPNVAGVSCLSPYLHFGEISPRMVWHAIRKAHNTVSSKGVDVYLSQLGWREFAHHLLYHFPKTPELPLRAEFSAFPWKIMPEFLEAWQKGATGYPIVDAGMRQLWQTGWMHNRVRMIVGSFLVKDLLITWLEGARWFWDTLVDADLANNTLGWQWIGGCGADAAPYFRVFNPITQGEKFDADGEYVKLWIPELSNMPKKWVHKPWTAPDDVLHAAGVRLGKDYPLPIVDHDKARVQALESFQSIRG